MIHYHVNYQEVDGYFFLRRYERDIAIQQFLIIENVARLESSVAVGQRIEQLQSTVQRFFDQSDLNIGRISVLIVDIEMIASQSGSFLSRR